MFERRIEWTARARAHVLARRKADVPATKLDRAALWRELVARIDRDSVEAGLATTEPALRRAVRGALALLSERSPSEVSASLPWAVILALSAGGGMNSGAPMGFVVASASVRTAVRLFARAMQLSVRDARAIEASETPSMVWPSVHLRYALLSAPASTRRWARELLADAFERGNLRLRAEVLSILPGEVDWAARVTRELIEVGPYQWPIVDHLLGALDDAGLVSALLAWAPPGLWRYERALDALGLDAAPILLSLAGKQRNDMELGRLLEALTIVGDPDVARLMSTLPKRRFLRPHVEQHRARFPELWAQLESERRRSRAAAKKKKSDNRPMESARASRRAKKRS